MSTAQDFIKTALRRVNSYQSGEQLAPNDAADCLEVFNDLLDSLSTDKQCIYGSNENVLTYTAAQSRYMIGNPTNASLGLANFTGTVTGGSNTITGVTSIPSGLVAGTTYTGVNAGSTLSDTQNLFPANTYVTAIGATTVTMSANATANSQGLDSIGYTVPGNFAIPRPLRITHGFTRYSQLDFPIEVTLDQTHWTEILYKAQPGPWPTVAWYNNKMPYGEINFYQTPSSNAELHLFTDTILQNLTLSSTVILPQGYARALKWLLAEEIWLEYCAPLPIPPDMKQKAKDSLTFIKALNALPAPQASYDSALIHGDRPDGGFILHGGYR